MPLDPFFTSRTVKPDPETDRKVIEFQACPGWEKKNYIDTVFDKLKKGDALTSF